MSNMTKTSQRNNLKTQSEVTLDVPKELRQQMNPRKLNLKKLEMHELGRK